MNSYIPLLMLFAFVGLLGGAILVISHLFSPNRMTPEKALSYECGLNAVGTPRQRFSVKFYLVAMLFILFDVEVVFLYPWAILFKENVKQGNGVFLFTEMSIFLGTLLVGLIYVYSRKAVDWSER